MPNKRIHVHEPSCLVKVEELYCVAIQDIHVESCGERDLYSTCLMAKVSYDQAEVSHREAYLPDRDAGVICDRPIPHASFLTAQHGHLQSQMIWPYPSMAGLAVLAQFAQVPCTLIATSLRSFLTPRLLMKLKVFLAGCRAVRLEKPDDVMVEMQPP